MRILSARPRGDIMSKQRNSGGTMFAVELHRTHGVKRREDEINGNIFRSKGSSIDAIQTEFECGRLNCSISFD